MNRIALLAGLFAALAPGVADADPITYGTTPFTGNRLKGTLLFLADDWAIWAGKAKGDIAKHWR